ncbi:MAG TPA: type III pantothenate kinase [Cyclobacteriaceae bacterium]|nr:type III pantothenate kinase [Cyclobacteriaceae bacterium]
MNIVIDNGNTRSKVGIFEKDVLIRKEIFGSMKELRAFLKGTKARNALVSSVAISDSDLSSWELNAERIFFLDHRLPLPIRNLYATPKTLGVDRLAAACGAHVLFPNTDVLVIDAGTCINYEFINRNGEYLGGAISPGLTMRFESMQQGTAKLPLGVIALDPPLTGNSTLQCLQSGVMNGAIEEVRGIVARYVSTYPGLRVILCGGDANVFENHLNPSIFVAPELVLKGLNSILLHNVAL